MSDDGWVKLYRKMTNWCWYKDPITKAVFLHLLLTANSSETPMHCRGGYEIKRGQVATSYQQIADECGITYKQSRTAISHLLRSGEVAVSRKPSISIISIEKFNDYQATGRASGNQLGNQLGNHPNKQEEKKIRSATDNAVSTAYPRTRSGLPRLMKKKKEVSENEQQLQSDGRQ